MKFRNIFKRKHYVVIIFLIILFILSLQAISIGQSFESFYKIVVIDPGHGGRDNGSCGTDNTKEKSITLTLSLIIKNMLGDNYKVMLTRNDDYGVDLNDRSAIANNQKADLFISLHAGGSFNHMQQGSTVYYFQDIYKTALASQNTKHEQVSENVDPIYWKSIQIKHIENSRIAADILSLSIKNQIHDMECDIQNVPLIVLSGADMPAVLIEIGNMANPAEEKKMYDNKYLTDFAKGICKGIDDFFEKKAANMFQNLR